MSSSAPVASFPATSGGDEDGGTTSSDDEGQRHKRVRDANVAFPYQALIRVPFTTAKSARYVATAMEVDKEISPEKVWREITVDVQDERVLVFDVKAVDARMLKAALLSLFDMTATCIRILCEFDKETR